MQRVLVIGGTGRVGREVLAQLPEGVVSVRAMVRKPENAGIPPHVEVVSGDLTDPDSIERCLAGIDTVFLVWTAPASVVPLGMDCILHRAKRLVYLSAPWKTAHPFFQAAQPNPVTALHAEIESRIAAAGTEWTFLRPGMFATNTSAWWGAQIRAGASVVRWPFPSAATAPIDERDIAAVAVRALCEESHHQAEYVLTGPESLTQSEQLAMIGAQLRRPLLMEGMPVEEAERGFLPGTPAFVTRMLLTAWAAAARVPALVTDTVESVTGNPARTFRQWVKDHADHFRIDS